MRDEEIAARVGSSVDRWQLRRVVGRGGMAAVYEAYDPDGQRAAVKVLHDQYVGRGTVQRRFLREAFIMGVAKHPRAVQVFGQGVAGGTPYFAMEYLEGQTLQKHWSAIGKMPPADVVGYAISLLEVLAAYHAEGVVHRDIKPANLLMSGPAPSGFSGHGIRLVDFGVARYRDMGTAAAEYTRDGATLGTPPFMPPEQALGKIDRIDQRSDVFAVGALMYALLAAKFVHPGANNDEMLISAASKPAESVIAVAPNTPPKLVEVIDRALSFYPNDRFADAKEMLAALDSLGISAGVSTGPVRTAFAAGPSTGPMAQTKFDAGGPNTPPPVAGVFDKAAVVAAIGAEAFESIHTNITEAVTVMFRGLRRVFDAAQLYDVAHPEVERRIDEALQLIGQILLEYPDDCVFQVRMSTFDVQERHVWEPKPPFDQIPYHMFMNGIRSVRFRPGLTRRELKQFLTLIIKPTADYAAEDDLATALWDLDLTHITTRMVTTFTVSDDVHQQRQFELEVENAVNEQQAYLERELAELLQLLAMVAEAGQGALAQAKMLTQKSAVEYRLSGGGFESKFRPQFIEALGRDAWELRAALVSAAALQESHVEHDLRRLAPTFQAILPRYMLQERDADGFMWAERVVARTEQANVRSRVLGWMFNPDMVRRLMFRLMNDSVDIDDDTRRRISQLLAQAPPDAIEEVLEHFPALDARQRRIVMTFLKHHAVGRQTQYAQVAADAPADVARDVVQILDRVVDDGTPEALRILLRHPDVSVRTAALGVLAQKYPQRAESILLPMINDEAADVRVQALRLARELNSAVVRDALAEQMRSSKFHGLPFTERRLTVETLHGIDPDFAEQMCVELVRKKLNLAMDPAVHTTRIMAAQFLGDNGMTKDGWEALHEGSKRWPGNPQNVRDACVASIERWKARAQ